MMFLNSIYKLIKKQGPSVESRTHLLQFPGSSGVWTYNNGD